MGLEANLVYLEDEIINLQTRASAIRDYLKSNPSSSIYRRRIAGRIYYYKKYRIGKRSISEYLGNEKFDVKTASLQVKGENEKNRRARIRLSQMRKEIAVLKRQARIVRKVVSYARP